MESPSACPSDLYALVAARAQAQLVKTPKKPSASAELNSHADPIVTVGYVTSDETTVLRWGDITAGSPNLSPLTVVQSFELLPGCVVPTPICSQQN